MTDSNTVSVFDASGDNSAQVGAAGPAYLDYLHVVNPNTVQAFIQLFDVVSGSVTVGTTTPTHSFIVPAGDGTKSGAFEQGFYRPIQFRKALTYACTTTATGNTALTTALTVNLVVH